MGTLISAAVLVGMFILAGMGIWAIIVQIQNQKEYDQIKKELEHEIYHGGNVTRISALRKRLLELENAGCRRR